VVVVGVGSASLGGIISVATVPVENVGNGPDADTGYGAVDYAYRIGKFEVTAGQYCEFLNAVAKTDTYGVYNSQMMWVTGGCKIGQSGPPGGHTYYVNAEWANRPVNTVSWTDAVRFANWLHNGQPTGAQDSSTTEDGAYDLTGTHPFYSNGSIVNLNALRAALVSVTRRSDWNWAIPSADEWYKAAYHWNDGNTGNYFDYPTSSDTPPGYVDKSGNLSGTDSSFTEGGADPGNYATYSGDDWGAGIGSPYYQTTVGEWENSASPYGTFDQGGNVWEWTEEKRVGDRGLRGGAFGDAEGLQAWYNYRFRAWYDDVDFGFRVVQVPEPATFALLVFGGLAVLRRRRS